MPSEFQFKEPPLALGIPKSCPSWCMDIFWNCPMTGVLKYLYQSSIIKIDINLSLLVKRAL